MPSTVRSVTYDVLRALDMTTVFGNPGSTEEPFLTGFPDDFRYVLGLHEAVVVAMADGYAQASGNAAFVNLHTAAGVGNGLGSLVTAWHNHTPLVITAGQQTRQMLALEPWLVNLEATELPRPYVKWSYEPVRPDDVPGAIERAYHVAMAPPQGPVFVSIPMDDWAAPAEERAVRRVSSRSQPPEAALFEVASALVAASNPAIVVGGGVDRADGWQAAVALAERLNAAGLGGSGTGTRLVSAGSSALSGVSAVGHEAARRATGRLRRRRGGWGTDLPLLPAHSRSDRQRKHPAHSPHR